MIEPWPLPRRQKMRRSATTSALLVAASICFAGCEETATKQVRVQPPASAPTPAASYAREPLPLSQRPFDPAFEAYYPRPAIDVLVDQVQASFTAGQQALESKKLDVAQTDFDHAVDLILQSGFQKDSDPRLAKLFDEIGDAVPSEPLNASEASAAEIDVESETPAQPARVCI